VLIRPILKKTPYELFNGRKPNINHLRVFGCSCFVLNNGKENLGKFVEKADHGIFISYSLTSHAFKIYNKRLKTIEESVHDVFDEVDHKSIQIPKTSAEEDEQNISLEKLEISAEKQPVNLLQCEDNIFLVLYSIFFTLLFIFLGFMAFGLYSK